MEGAQSGVYSQCLQVRLLGVVPLQIVDYAGDPIVIVQTPTLEIRRGYAPPILATT